MFEQQFTEGKENSSSEGSLRNTYTHIALIEQLPTNTPCSHHQFRPSRSSTNQKALFINQTLNRSMQAGRRLEYRPHSACLPYSLSTKAPYVGKSSMNDHHSVKNNSFTLKGRTVFKCSYQTLHSGEGTPSAYNSINGSYSLSLQQLTHLCKNLLKAKNVNQSKKLRKTMQNRPFKPSVPPKHFGSPLPESHHFKQTLESDCSAVVVGKKGKIGKSSEGKPCRRRRRELSRPRGQGLEKGMGEPLLRIECVDLGRWSRGQFYSRVSPGAFRNSQLIQFKISSP